MGAPQRMIDAHQSDEPAQIRIDLGPTTLPIAIFNASNVENRHGATAPESQIG